jgi:hypothetical protein
MNLNSRVENVIAARNPAPRRLRFVEVIFGQNQQTCLDWVKPFFMSSLSLTCKPAVCLCWALVFALPVAVLGQANYYITNGTEYAIAGSLPGDQVWPDVAVTPSGGFVVWQDNATDGSGWGVSALRYFEYVPGERPGHKRSGKSAPGNV